MSHGSKVGVVSSVETFTVPPRWTFVKVTCDEGQVGWGEAIVPKRRRAVLGALADLSETVRGQDGSRIEVLSRRMRREAFFRGGPILSTAAAAIEEALWDIKARSLGVPVYDLLGGATRQDVPVYAWIGGDEPSDLVQQTRQRVAQGYTAVKMNASAAMDYVETAASIDAVAARVAAVRSEGGSGLKVAVDFHGRVHRAVAKALFRELEQFNLLWAEEPLGPEHGASLADIAAVAGSIPVATGERLCTLEQFKDLLSVGGVDVIQPDISLTGVFELMKICHLADAYDVAVAPHCPNGPLSLAGSLQVDCCTTNVPIQEQSSGMHYNKGFGGTLPAEMGDYLVDPDILNPVAGRLSRPIGPGLGVDLDEDKVKASSQAWHVEEPNWRHPDGRPAEW